MARLRGRQNSPRPDTAAKLASRRSSFIPRLSIRERAPQPRHQSLDNPSIQQLILRIIPSLDDPGVSPQGSGFLFFSVLSPSIFTSLHSCTYVFYHGKLWEERWGGAFGYTHLLILEGMCGKSWGIISSFLFLKPGFYEEDMKGGMNVLIITLFIVRDGGKQIFNFITVWRLARSILCYLPRGFNCRS